MNPHRTFHKYLLSKGYSYRVTFSPPRGSYSYHPAPDVLVVRFCNQAVIYDASLPAINSKYRLAGRIL